MEKTQLQKSHATVPLLQGTVAGDFLAWICTQIKFTLDLAYSIKGTVV